MEIISSPHFYPTGFACAAFTAAPAKKRSGEAVFIVEVLYRRSLTGPVIFHGAPSLDSALSFEENRLRTPARG